MDTLDGTEWDVIIEGTGLPQSLLALALSRSGKKILHVDANEYYGGDEAALSLSEAEAWTEKHAGETSASFRHATVTRPEHGDGGPKLSYPRAYSLSLAPHLVYTRSSLLPALVSSRTHGQLEFQAVGSWFVVDAPSTETSSQAKLTKVPNGREDIFQDTTFDLRAKRALMKFLRFVGNFEEQPEIWQQDSTTAFPTFLERKFGLPSASHGPLMALTLATEAPMQTSTEFALPRIARHLRSIGLFGPGFGAVLPKWGGLAELAQVACRACAVGGGVYVLKKGINSFVSAGDGAMQVELADGEKAKSTWLVRAGTAQQSDGSGMLSKSMTVVSSPLTSLFPPTSEGGVTPAGAVVVVPSDDLTGPLVHIFVHASDSGECPPGQATLYASVSLPHQPGRARLEAAVNSLLQAVGEPSKPSVLWSLQYEQHARTGRSSDTRTDNILELQLLSLDLAFEDDTLDGVKTVWQKITGEPEETFMKFEPRGDAEEGEGLE